MNKTKVIWLGQAGLLFDNGETKIMIDPYLSNYAEKINPNSYRRSPIDESIFDIKPDIMIITHNHIDHLDPETMSVFTDKYNGMTMLAPLNAWTDLRKSGSKQNFVMFNPHTIWSERGFTFSAVKAEHSDLTAVGVIIDDGVSKFYVSGDTLYSQDVVNDIKIEPDVAFLPINGTGNNMNMTDAQKFAAAIKAKKVVPVHFGMFDEINPENFVYKNKVIPEIYKEIEL